MRGRTPTCCSVFFDKLVPIRNNVAVSPALPRWLSDVKLLRSHAACGARYVLIAAATQNIPMNQGIFTFAVPDDRPLLDAKRAM
jgi:hypothetical protein